MLKEEDVKEFQRIYKERLGRDISYKEAYEKAMRLLRFVKAVYGLLEAEIDTKRN
jgi:hypothetical protein